PAPPPSGAAVPSMKGTMMGVSVTDAALVAARAQPNLQGATPAGPNESSDSSGAGKRAPPAKTMLGVPSPSPMEVAPPGSEAQGRGKTMLGVAIPGIAPLAAGQANAPSIDPAATPSTRGGTMLGVAIPGIAPTSPGAPGLAASPNRGTAAMPGPVVAPFRSKVANTAIAEAPVLPAPPPFVDDVPMPRAPVVRPRTGVPVAVVAGIVAGLVLVGGALIFLFARGGPPVVAQAKIDDQGSEILHLQCDNCTDGTSASLGGSQAEFKGHAADLALSKPLDVGPNTLDVQLDRPGSGRDETVKLTVSVPYFIQADLSDIGAKPPVVRVRVAASPGAIVTVDGKHLALDGSGKGAYTLDVSSETEGPSDDVRAIDKKIPYIVLSKDGKPESGVVTARIAVVPLRVDIPSAAAVVDSPSFVVAGQTSPGAGVLIDDKPVTPQADGSFAEPHDAAAGTSSVEVRATAQGRAPRTVHLSVKRVASLDAEAKALEKTPLLTYDSIAEDIPSKVGQHAVVAGEVIEARNAGHLAIALVNDVRGCKTGPCLARVIASADSKIAKGDKVRAYGTVARAVPTSTGKTIPELAADFVVRAKR
ncbi:MAG TPA: hypothetical protein VGI39_08110, partial [Polyangiaceae bacterium]